MLICLNTSPLFQSPSKQKRVGVKVWILERNCVNVIDSQWPNVTVLHMFDSK